MPFLFGLLVVIQLLLQIHHALESFVSLALLERLAPCLVKPIRADSKLCEVFGGTSKLDLFGVVPLLGVGGGHGSRCGADAIFVCLLCGDIPGLDEILGFLAYAFCAELIDGFIKDESLGFLACILLKI